LGWGKINQKKSAENTQLLEHPERVKIMNDFSSLNAKLLKIKLGELLL